MSIILQTKRLILRQFTFADAAFIIQLLNSPGWLQYIGNFNISTQHEAENYLLNGPVKSYQTNGFGLALVAMQQTETPIGMCGLIKRAYLNTPDIGFALLPQYIGQGYAYEIASATLLHAKEVLHIKTVAAITLPENTQSISLLQKLGLQFQHNIIPPNSSNETLMLFSTP